MRWFRWGVVISGLLISLWLAFVGGRLFPFSDYPMFAYLRTDLSTYALACEVSEQKPILLDSSVVGPMVRLHLAQFLRISLQSDQLDSKWSRRVWERIRKQQIPCDRLNIIRAEFVVDDRGHLKFEHNASRTLRELPPP